MAVARVVLTGTDALNELRQSPNADPLSGHILWNLLQRTQDARNHPVGKVRRKTPLGQANYDVITSAFHSKRKLLSYATVFGIKRAPSISRAAAGQTLHRYSQDGLLSQVEARETLTVNRGTETLFESNTTITWTHARPCPAIRLDTSGSLRRDSQAGHARAARKALAAQAKPLFSELSQRVGFLKSPNVEAVNYIRTLQTPATPQHVRRAATFTIGTMARKLHQAGPQAEAQALTQLLKTSLADASGADDRANVVRAMGNAGLSSIQDTVVGAATADTPVERGAAASAMRHLPSTAAMNPLLNLLSDESPSVQQAALSSVNGRLSEPGALAQLTAVVSAGHSHRSNDPQLVGLVGPHAPQPEAIKVLEFVRARSCDDPAIRTRIARIISD